MIRAYKLSVPLQKTVYFGLEKSNGVAVGRRPTFLLPANKDIRDFRALRVNKELNNGFRRIVVVVSYRKDSKKGWKWVNGELNIKTWPLKRIFDLNDKQYFLLFWFYGAFRIYIFEHFAKYLNTILLIFWMFFCVFA